MRDRSIRASDADREAAATALRENHISGRLTLEEFEERLGLAFAAKTLGDLDALLTDLPAPPQPLVPVETQRRGAKRGDARDAKKYDKQLASWQAQREAHVQLLLLAKHYRGGAEAGFICQPGETVFAKLTNTALIEERRQPGQYQGRSSGVSIPLGLGVRYRAGGSRGRYVQGALVPSTIDVGTVYVTNKRVVFRGAKQTRECRFDRTIGVGHDPRQGTTVVSVSNRQKPMVIRYGPKVAGWFAFRMDLGLAHYRGTTGALVSRLEAELAQIDERKPVSLMAPAVSRSEDDTEPVSPIAARSTVLPQPAPQSSPEPAPTTRKADADADPALQPDRAVGWGILFFAKRLARGIEAYQPEYERYLSGGAAPTGDRIADPLTYFRVELDRLAELAKSLTPWLAPAVVAKALGPRGSGGDKATIVEMANGIAGVYGSMIALGLRIRGATVPSKWESGAQALSDIMKMPLAQIRGFSEALTRQGAEYVSELRAGRLPERALKLTLTLDLDTGTFLDELGRLKGST